MGFARERRSWDQALMRAMWTHKDECASGHAMKQKRRCGAVMKACAASASGWDESGSEKNFGNLFLKKNPSIPFSHRASVTYLICPLSDLYFFFKFYI